VEKKARRGNFFYGCANYPKCDFTAATKPVAESCPECGSPYLLEKVTKEGTFLICPNSKAPAKSKAKPKTKDKGKQKPEAVAVACDFSKKIAEAPLADEPTVA
jgi:DNA topoisomerase-1